MWNWWQIPVRPRLRERARERTEASRAIAFAAPCPACFSCDPTAAHLRCAPPARRPRAARTPPLLLFDSRFIGTGLVLPTATTARSGRCDCDAQAKPRSRAKKRKKKGGDTMFAVLIFNDDVHRFADALRACWLLPRC